VVPVVFAGLAGASALLDWWAVAVDRKRVEYLAKPATLVALTVVAATLATPEPSVRDWFVAALVLCLAGDVLLMLPGERTESFAGGLGSFLAAHVLFLVGMLRLHPHLLPFAVALGVLVAGASLPLGLVLRGVARHLGAAMVGPVVVYVCALLAMAAVSWSVGLDARSSIAGAVLIAGGTTFVVSDTLLSLDRFVKRLPLGSTLVHASYHLAVAGLVMSLAGALGAR
jgi:uncharacterized membrane protein YhhN